MQLTFRPTGIEGVALFSLPVFCDTRGSFRKMFHAPAFARAGFACEIREEFFTISKRNVIRGMHFQLPPAAHFKFVTCVAGAVLDVVLDVRKSSPTHGRFLSLELSGGTPEGIALAPGIAHGFLALTDGACVHYLTSREHMSECDSGVRWDSFGMAWPVEAPIVSERDSKLAPFADLGEIQWDTP